MPKTNTHLRSVLVAQPVGIFRSLGAQTVDNCTFYQIRSRAPTAILRKQGLVDVNGTLYGTTYFGGKLAETVYGRQVGLPDDAMLPTWPSGRMFFRNTPDAMSVARPITA